MMSEEAASVDLVEVRLPDTGWVKAVASVPATAKTGYDWEGDFLRSGRLVDLAPGTLLVWGWEYGPIRLGMVRLDGEIDWWARVRGRDEWAIRLRGLARRYLAASPGDREAVLALGRSHMALQDRVGEVEGRKDLLRTELGQAVRQDELAGADEIRRKMADLDQVKNALLQSMRDIEGSK